MQPVMLEWGGVTLKSVHFKTKNVYKYIIYFLPLVPIQKNRKKRLSTKFVNLMPSVLKKIGKIISPSSIKCYVQLLTNKTFVLSNRTNDIGRSIIYTITKKKQYRSIEISIWIWYWMIYDGSLEWYYCPLRWHILFDVGLKRNYNKIFGGKRTIHSKCRTCVEFCKVFFRRNF